MKLMLARTSGFCFGVEHAVQTAYELAGRDASDQADESPVYMLGELIHNRQVVDDLLDHGMTLAKQADDIPDGSTVLIRAHGVPPAILCDLESRRSEERRVG